jgi:hypothetical protein
VRHARSTTLLVALAQCGSSACAHPCPSNRFCNTSTWVTAADEPIVEGRSVLLFASRAFDPSSGPFADPEALNLRPRALFLRFDLSTLHAQGSVVERATLLLAPHPTWSTQDRSVRVAVYPLSGVIDPSTGEAPLAEDPTTVATVPLQLRGPVRLDVTRAVQSWQDGARPDGALALSADTTGLVVQGAAATREDRPRLEVIVR